MKKRSLKFSVHMKSGRTFRSIRLPLTNENQAFADEVLADFSMSSFKASTVFRHTYIRFKTDEIESICVTYSVLPFHLFLLGFSFFNRASHWR